MNIIFPLSMVDGIMGGFVFMYEFMHVCKNVCISVYMYVGVHACMYVVWRMTLSMSKRKQNS